ncbi:hypothetical protein MLO08_23805, partial [Escherichia coli]|nr:hypothetical protein [Escherichia coli]
AYSHKWIPYDKLVNNAVKIGRTILTAWIKQVPDLLFFISASDAFRCFPPSVPAFSLPASRMTDRTHKCVLPEPEINPDF